MACRPVELLLLDHPPVDVEGEELVGSLRERGEEPPAVIGTSTARFPKRSAIRSRPSRPVREQEGNEIAVQPYRYRETSKRCPTGDGPEVVVAFPPESDRISGWRVLV